MSLSSASSHLTLFAKSQYFTQSGNQSADAWTAIYVHLITALISTTWECMRPNTTNAILRNMLVTSQNLNVVESSGPDAAAWNAPIVEDPALTIGEMKMRESRMHVDHVQDMVPFWIRGVEAAEKGEVLRLEQFLETLQAASDAWLNVASGDPWTQVDQEWGDDAWGIQGDKIQEWDTTNEKADGWDFTLGADAWGVDTKSISSVHGAIRMGALGEWQRQQGQGKKFARKKQSPKDAYNFVEEVARQQAVDDERKRQMHSFFNMPTHEKIKKIDEVIRYLHNVRCQSQAFRD